MDTRQLETFLAITQQGGFAAAARAVNLTASAVSQQIAALEAEVGAALFDRSRRPPALTSKGAEVLAAARTILRIVTETKAAVTGSEVRGTLALGTLRTAGSAILPQALARLCAVYPELTYRLQIGMAEDLMAEVVSGQLDAALVADHVAVPPSLRWTPVISEPLVVLTPPGLEAHSVAAVVRATAYIRYRTAVPLARQIDTGNCPPRGFTASGGFGQHDDGGDRMCAGRTGLCGGAAYGAAGPVGVYAGLVAFRHAALAPPSGRGAAPGFPARRGAGDPDRGVASGRASTR